MEQFEARENAGCAAVLPCVRACVCVRSVVSANISDLGFHSEINASFRAISTRATQFEIPASLCHEMLGYPGVHVDHVSAWHCVTVHSLCCVCLNLMTHTADGSKRASVCVQLSMRRRRSAWVLPLACLASYAAIMLYFSFEFESRCNFDAVKCG